MRGNVLKVLSGNTLAAGLSFLLSLALARMLSVEDFGEVSYAFTLSMLLAYLVGGGIGSFSIVTLPRSEDKTLFTRQINHLLAKSLLGLVLLAAPVIAALAIWKGATPAYLASAVVAGAVGIAIIQQTFWLHQANGLFGLYGKQQALNNLIRAVVVLSVGAIAHGYGAPPVVALVAASAAASILVALWLIKCYYSSWKIRSGNESYQVWRKDLGHMLATAGIITLATRLDQLIGKELLSPEAFGHYALASTLALALTMLQAAFMSVSLHSAAQGGTWKQVRKQQQRLLPWLLVLSALIVAVAPWAVPLVFGDRYAGSVAIFQVLALIPISGMLFTPVETFFSAREARAVTQAKALQMVGALGLGIGAGYLFGAVGMALAVLLSRWLGWAKLQHMGNKTCYEH